MIKKIIRYTDLNGKAREEEHYFHIWEHEVVELELSERGGLTSILPELLRTRDASKLMELFKRLIRLSYGVRSEDGSDFNKDEEASDRFMKSQAYNALFMDMMRNPEEAWQFIIQMFPADLASQMASAKSTLPADIAEQMKEAGIKLEMPETPPPPPVLKDDPSWKGPPWTGRTPSYDELLNMSPADFAEYQRRVRFPDTPTVIPAELPAGFRKPEEKKE